MGKDVIETLIAICKEKQQNITSKISVYFDEGTEKLHEGAINILARDLQQAMKCIDHLQKLKEFEFPTEIDIIERSVEFKNETPYEQCDMTSFRVGGLWMLTLIKSKLLW